MINLQALQGWATQGIKQVKKKPEVNFDSELKPDPIDVQNAQKPIEQDKNIWTALDNPKFLKRDKFDIMAKRMKEDGYTSDQIMQAVESQGYEVEGWRQFQEKNNIKQTKKESNLLKNIIWGVGESATSLWSFWAEKVIWWLEKAWVGEKLESFWQRTGIADKLNSWSMKHFGVPFSNGDENYSEFDIWENEDSLAFKWAKLLTDLAQTASITNIWGNAIKWVPAVGKVSSTISSQWPQLLKQLWLSEKAITKAMPIITKTLKHAGEWAIDMGVFNTIAEKELPTVKELGLWAGLWVVAPMAWTLVKKLWKWVYRQFIPKTEKEIQAIIKNKAGLWSTPYTTTDTSINKNLWGTKSKMGQKALKEQNRLRNEEIYPALEWAKDKISKDELLEWARKFVDDLSIPSEKKKYKKILDKFENDFWDDLTLTEAQILKSSIDKVTPNKIMAGEKWAIEKTLQNKVANQIRTLIRNKLGGNVWKNYEDFSNLYNIVKMGEESLKTWKAGGAVEKKLTWGSSLGILWHALSDISQPVGTGIGLLLKKMWENMSKDSYRRIISLLGSKEE